MCDQVSILVYGSSVLTGCQQRRGKHLVSDLEKTRNSLTSLQLRWSIWYYTRAPAYCIEDDWLWFGECSNLYKVSAEATATIGRRD